MDDAVGWIVAIGFCFFTLRYFFGSNDAAAGAAGAAPRPRRQIPQASIDQVAAMFPHIPTNSIRYELERVGGNVEVVVERCLRDGRLPEPPAGFFADPALPPRPVVAPATPSASTTSATPPTPSSLIARLGLQARVSENGDDAVEGKGKGKEKAPAPAWEASVEAREKSLKERKAKMVLEARRKLLEKEQARKAAATP